MAKLLDAEIFQDQLCMPADAAVGCRLPCRHTAELTISGQEVLFSNSQATVNGDRNSTSAILQNSGRNGKKLQRKICTCTTIRVRQSYVLSLLKP
jgi:hypothetical protein